MMTWWCWTSSCNISSCKLIWSRNPGFCIDIIGRGSCRATLNPQPTVWLHSATSKGWVAVEGLPWELEYIPCRSTWGCLKMGYTTNYSHLVGIMISKTIGCRVHYFQTNPHVFPKDSGFSSTSSSSDSDSNAPADRCWRVRTFDVLNQIVMSKTYLQYHNMYLFLKHTHNIKKWIYILMFTGIYRARG